MNKSQLVDAVKEKISFTKKDIELVVSTLFDTIAETLQQEIGRASCRERV